MTERCCPTHNIPDCSPLLNGCTYFTIGGLLEKAHQSVRHDAENRPRKGDWMQTFTGNAFWPLDPRADEVVLDDIFHSLAMQCRYAGHVDRFYSVAEHCVLISEYLEPLYGPHIALQGLAHDFTEAYVVDLPRPVKRSIEQYSAIEHEVHLAICEALDLPDVFDSAVKDADNRILMDERLALLKMPPPIPWRSELEPLGVTISGWSPAFGAQMIEGRYWELLAILEGQP